MAELAWQPETFGAARENHLMRTTTVVRTVRYGKGRIAYSTFDAPSPCEDVLRLAFAPTSISADGKALQTSQDAGQNGFTVKPLANGDCLLTIRHDGCRDIVVEGDDPQETLPHDRLSYVGPWSAEDCATASDGKLHVASLAGAGPRGLHRQSNSSHRPRRPQRRQGRRGSRRREATLRH